LNFDSLNITFCVSAGLILLLLERLPRHRNSAASIQHRWVANIGLVLLGGLLVALLFRDSATQVANKFDSGLFRVAELPIAVEVALVFLLLDCWRYWEHRAMHEIWPLWRVHLVHHSDTGFDVTTSQRHHPFEPVITTFLVLLLIIALGFSATSLGVYLLVASVSAVYTHTSLTLPDNIDRQLRRWLVTPSVHAVHHSAHQPETDSNYGAVLTIWDRLFGTYLDPEQAAIPRFGLAHFRTPAQTTLAATLLQPFETRSDPQPISTASENPANIAATATFPTPWRQALGFAAGGTVLVLLAMWPAVKDLAITWNSESYRYAWLVIPTFVWLLAFHHRNFVLALRPRPGYVGLIPAVVALMLWVSAVLVDIKLGQHLALVVALQAVTLSALGWHVYRRLIPIMLILFLLVPCGDLLLTPLRDLAVKWIEWTAFLLDAPFTNNGYAVQVGEYDYVVATGCAGLTAFTMAAFLGYSYGAMLFRSVAKVVTFALICALLGILSNGLRLAAIITIDWISGFQISMRSHSDVQMLLLLVFLGLIIYIASRLSHESIDLTTGETVNPAFPLRQVARSGPVVTGILIAATALSMRGLSDAAATNHDQMAALPQLAANHPGSHWLDSDKERGQILSLPIGDAITAVIILNPDKVSRLPINTLSPRGKDSDVAWRHVATEEYRDCAPRGCVDFIQLTWKNKNDKSSQSAFYTYFVGDRVTSSKLVFRLASGWNRLRGFSEASGLIGLQVNKEVSQDFRLSGIFLMLQETIEGATPVRVVAR
jgi:exosortase